MPGPAARLAGRASVPAPGAATAPAPTRPRRPGRRPARPVRASRPGVRCAAACRPTTPRRPRRTGPVRTGTASRPGRSSRARRTPRRADHSAAPRTAAPVRFGATLGAGTGSGTGSPAPPLAPRSGRYHRAGPEFVPQVPPRVGLTFGQPGQGRACRSGEVGVRGPSLSEQSRQPVDLVTEPGYFLGQCEYRAGRSGPVSVRAPQRPVPGTHPGSVHSGHVVDRCYLLVVVGRLLVVSQAPPPVLAGRCIAQR